MKRLPLSLAMTLFYLLTNGCGRVASMEQGVALGQQDGASPSEPVGRPVTEHADDAFQGQPARPAAGSETYGNRYGLRPDYQACMTHQPESVSTVGHRQDCADQEFEFQDSRLNRVYRQAMDALKNRNDRDNVASTRLRDTQRQWLSQLDKACAEAVEKAGSTMGPAAQSTCLMDTTAMPDRKSVV